MITAEVRAVAEPLSGIPVLGDLVTARTIATRKFRSVAEARAWVDRNRLTFIGAIETGEQLVMKAWANSGRIVARDNIDTTDGGQDA